MYEVIIGAKTTEETSAGPKESYNADARSVMVVALNVEEAIKKAALKENEIAESVARHHAIDAV
jgi:hypothetical protein